MKTFKEFMNIINEKVGDVVDASTHPDIGGQSNFQKKAAAEMRRRQQQRMGQNTRVPGEDIRGTGRAQATPPRSGPLARTGSSTLSTNVRTPVQQIRTNMNVPGRKIPGLKGGSVLSGVIDTALEKRSGSGWGRSLAKGATTALGTAVGGALGTAVAPGAGTFVGGAAGGMAASQAFDTVAGANAKDRAAMKQQKRQSQAGGALVGTGGPTSFSQKGKTGFISTGTGANRKTAQLGKTSVVNGQLGNLAFKTDPNTGQKRAVYKRSDTSNATLAKTSSNAWERIGRSINPNAYKASDAANRAAKLKTAAANDQKRNTSLGIKSK
tara:strand:+ start:834 stop:1805 length:972 start_codon:yes stop_codon:yes gene_type:complete